MQPPLGTARGVSSPCSAACRLELKMVGSTKEHMENTMINYRMVYEYGNQTSVNRNIIW